MATQEPGMVIVRNRGIVIVKAATLERGACATALAREIKHLMRAPSINEVIQFAGYTDFGTRQHLAIITWDGIHYQGTMPLGWVFVNTLGRVDINPWLGWLHTGPNCVVVDVPL